MSYYCRSCGYLLRGVAGQICPACGASWNLSDTATYIDDDQVARAKGIGVGWGIAGVCLDILPLPLLVRSVRNRSNGENFVSFACALSILFVLMIQLVLLVVSIVIFVRWRRYFDNSDKIQAIFSCVMPILVSLIMAGVLMIAS